MVSEQTFLAEILFATQLETLKARIIIEAVPRPPWSLTSNRSKPTQYIKVIFDNIKIQEIQEHNATLCESISGNGTRRF